MPLDVLGCTRVTLMHSASCLYDLETIVCNRISMHRDGDRLLQLPPIDTRQTRWIRVMPIT